MNEPLNLKSYSLLTCVKTFALNITVPTITFVKGTVHPKMKILSSFTHPQVGPHLYECVFSEHKGRYFEVSL